MPFLWTNIFKFCQFQLFFTESIEFFRNFQKKLKENNFKLKKELKTQAKNSKLKEKTQGPGGFFRAWETKWCYKKSLL